MSSQKKALAVVNQIVAVGSVDGVLTTAALLRVIGNADVPVIFCQAFTVDKIDPAQWQVDRQVAFVDLAVDLKDNAKTKAFVERIHAAGHRIVAVIDEHGRDLWQTCLGSFDGLIVEPQDRAVYPSSGSILLAALTSNEVDEHLFDLCAAAEAGDKMDFTTHFGSLANQAVKSNITDDARRVYLARHFAFNREADETISGWVQEYEQILANHAVIIAAKKDLGSGIVRVDATGQKVDMTTLMGELYKSGARIVVVVGEQFNPLKKEKMVMVSFGTNDKNLDLLAALKTASVPAGGIAQKANVEPEQEEVALATIRALLG